MKRTIVIGDIHGCYDELLALLEEIRFDSSDQVIATGDLTTKGPKSREVLDLFSKDSRFASVVGNHDLALVRHWKDEGVKLKSRQQIVFDDLKTGAEVLLEYLASLPGYIELDSHIVVHAGLRPGVPFNQQELADLVELRTLGVDRTSRDGVPWYDVYDDPKVALFGHWPAAKPRVAKAAIGLDTGCVYGYQLTGYIIETGEFHSVQAQAIYDDSAPVKHDKEHRISTGQI